jgi:AraC-like DNA-binding protein
LTAALTFTTRGVAAPERRRVLHALVEQGLLPIEHLSRVPSVELVKWRLPGASVLWGRFRSGPPACRVRGRRRPVRPTPSHLIGIRTPRHALPLDAGRHDEMPQIVPGHTPALRLLTGYLTALGACPAPASPELADAVVGHLRELVALSLQPRPGDPPPAAGRAVRAARLAALKTDIARHLADPALSVAALAARHGISVRYVHKLFEDDGRTYSQVVLDARLDHALRQLRDPCCALRTVSAIAGAAGFGDLSYFNRTFRRRYGMTPSASRGPSG